VGRQARPTYREGLVDLVQSIATDAIRYLKGVIGAKGQDVGTLGEVLDGRGGRGQGGHGQGEENGGNSGELHFESSLVKLDYVIRLVCVSRERRRPAAGIQASTARRWNIGQMRDVQKRRLSLFDIR
jgi:hypothetical protein